MAEILIIGGTNGIGRELAVSCLKLSYNVVIAGRDAERAARVAQEIAQSLPSGSGSVRGIAADLSKPQLLHDALSNVAKVAHLVVTAIDRDKNSLKSYDIDAAIQTSVVKLVGYPAAVVAILDRIEAGGSILLFGGMAKDRPYPGSTTVSSVNAAIAGLVNTMMQEVKPARVNAIHPGVVGDSPYWAGNEAALDFGRRVTINDTLPTMRDMVDGCLFLMRNPSANGINLSLDGGRV